MGSKESIKSISWDSASELKVEAGRKIPPAKPLFQKLDIKELQTKLDTIHGVQSSSENKASSSAKPVIDYKDFSKLDLRTGTIVDAEKVPDTSHLIKLQVDLGEESLRTIVAGIGKTYKAEELIGTQIVVLSNLAPKKLEESLLMECY